MTYVEQVAGQSVRGFVTAMAPQPPADTTDESRLIEDLGYNSLRLMELTLVLERAFSLPRYRPEQLADVRRVGDVVALVEQGRP